MGSHICPDCGDSYVAAPGVEHFRTCRARSTSVAEDRPKPTDAGSTPATGQPYEIDVTGPDCGEPMAEGLTCRREVGHGGPHNTWETPLRPGDRYLIHVHEAKVAMRRLFDDAGLIHPDWCLCDKPWPIRNNAECMNCGKLA